MAITSTGQNAAIYAEQLASTATKDKTALGKEDFMKLFLAELQNQDPTAPMDTEKILAQTSQLATIESADNTNQALTDLTAALGSTQQFSTISAIGKTADLGSNAITLDEGSSSVFEVYFPSDIKVGTVEILDKDGKVVGSVVDIRDKDGKIDGQLDDGTDRTAGVYKFDWDGKGPSGNAIDSGIYYVTASYTDTDGKAQTTRLGTYPIEAVRFDKGNTLVKVGSSYVPLENIKEVY